MAASEQGPAQVLVAKVVVVCSQDLDEVVDDDTTAIKQESLLEKLNCPIADELLQALRRVLTMTYTDQLKLEDLQRAFVSIRELLSVALRPLGEMLKLVKAPPVGPDKSWPQDDRVRIYKFVLARVRDLRFKVGVEGEVGKKPLLDVIDHQPADELLRTAREVLSMTFNEVFSPLEYRKLLGEIRQRCASVLHPCNALLEAMQIEPVAIPTLLGYEFLEEDLAEQAREEQERQEQMEQRQKARDDAKPNRPKRGGSR